uniref:Uncharacterized protein n=1 Tax=Kalanchoe fedtschenkoi TaxID=63787 RepID=A0A7N0SVD1_KALFE
MEEEEDDDFDLLEVEGFLSVLESNIPPHLHDLAAAQLGDVDALSCGRWGYGSLHLTCLYGYLPCVQLLLERGAPLEAKDEDGAIPLHDACTGGFMEIVQLLIYEAPDSDSVRRMLDAVDADGDTPLHHATTGDHLDIVRLLLASGASPSKANTHEKTPGDLAELDAKMKRVLVDACSSAGRQ